MTSNDFNRHLDEILKLKPGTLTGNELLDDYPQWDSLAVMEFIAMVDEKFGITIPWEVLRRCKSVADLWSVIHNQSP